MRDDERLDNISIKGKKIVLFENTILNNLMVNKTDIDVEYSDDNKDFERALDFIMFCISTNNNYIIKQLSDFGIQQEYIANILGYSNNSAICKSLISYDRALEKISDKLKDYEEMQNKIATIKSEYIKKGVEYD